MKKNIIIAVISLCFIFVFALNTSAYVPIEINPGVLKNVLKTLKQARCDKAKPNVEAKLDKLEKKRDKHQTAYQNMISRLETLLDKLEARGYSIGDIKAELTVLKDKVKTFGEDYQKFFDLMGEVKAEACGDQTDTEVKAKLKEARDTLKLVRQDAKAIRDYYFSVIRPDIKALKNQKP